MKTNNEIFRTTEYHCSGRQRQMTPRPPRERSALVQLGLAFALGTLVAACGGSDKDKKQDPKPTPAQVIDADTPFHMTLTDCGWSPQNLPATRGAKVTFTNSTSTSSVTVTWTGHLFGAHSTGTFNVGSTPVTKTISSTATCQADGVSYDDPRTGTITVSGRGCSVGLASKQP